MFPTLFGLTRRSARRGGRRPSAPGARGWALRRPLLEELETRLAPACNFYLSGGGLHADCDNTANTVTRNHGGTTTTLSDTSMPRRGWSVGR
jgi:hypothetical protein